MSYLEQPRVFGALIGSFVLVFVPLAYLELVPNDFQWLPHLLLLQAVGLGASHFFITLALYGNRDNLRYFGQSARNRLVYFVAPLAFFVFFAFIGGRGLSGSPFFAIYFFPAIRILDFVHVGRQSFGVTQLLNRSVAGLPRRLRTLENLTFAGLALLEWQTALTGGRFVSGEPSELIPAGVVGCVVVFVVSQYLKHGEETGDLRRVAKPLAYFAMQVACAGAAIYRTRLYLVALTLHYVEYHLLMSPRLFAPAAADAAVPANDAEAPAQEPVTALRDAAASTAPRARVIAFYVALLALVTLFEARNHVTVPASISPVVHVFDGIFVVHYFIEAFVWKFTNPHYRASLVPLYFGGATRGEGTRERRSGRRLPSLVELAAIGLVMIATIWAFSANGAVGAMFERRVVKRMRAEQELEWGADLAERGELAPATERFERAVALDPGNGRAERALAEARRRGTPSSADAPAVTP